LKSVFGVRGAVRRDAGERFREGIIEVLDDLAEAKRATEDLVGVMSELLRIGGLEDWRTVFFGVAISAGGRTVEVSGPSDRFTRLVPPKGTFEGEGFCSGSSKQALELLRFKDFSTGWKRPGCALKAEGCPAIESIFLNSVIWASLKRPALPLGMAIFLPSTVS
jgi:hypothetical protein